MDSVQHELLAGLTETWLPPEAAELEQHLEDDWASVEALLSDWTARHSAEIADRYVRELTCAGSENRWEAVVRSAAAGDTDWMRGYGLPITEVERAMAAFWFRYPPERVQHIAEHIVSAFLHGFLSQSRDRRGRTHVRMYYCVGQEALVQAVLRVLDARGVAAYFIEAALSEPQRRLCYEAQCRPRGLPQREISRSAAWRACGCL